jgi:hypothetical protein
MRPGILLELKAKGRKLKAGKKIKNVFYIIDYSLSGSICLGVDLSNVTNKRLMYYHARSVFLSYNYCIKSFKPYAFGFMLFYYLCQLFLKKQRNEQSNNQN